MDFTANVSRAIAIVKRDRAAIASVACDPAASVPGLVFLAVAVAASIVSNGIRPGIAGMFKTLAGDLARDGITVNMVLPGRIRTDRFLGHQKDLAARAGISLEEWIATRSTPDIPMGRIGTPEEFGDMVVFLGSQRASYVTGCVVQVDGGLIKSVV